MKKQALGGGAILTNCPLKEGKSDGFVGLCLSCFFSFRFVRRSLSHLSTAATSHSHTHVEGVSNTRSQHTKPIHLGEHLVVAPNAA
jgi:hypothetical protein